MIVKVFMTDSQHNPEQGTKDELHRWLVTRGFSDNPFEHSNAEREHDLPDYFVDIGGLDDLLHTQEPCIVLAERGCGKTTQRQMLAAQCRPTDPLSSRLAILYTYPWFEFALELAENHLELVSSNHHINALLRSAVSTLADEVWKNPGMLEMMKHQGSLTLFGTFVASYAPLKMDPSWPFGKNLIDSLTPIERLTAYASLLSQLGFRSGVVLVDGLDEFQTTAKDPTQAIQFIAPMMGTLPLIECAGMSFKFFLPQEMEESLRKSGWFRSDRLSISRIRWDEDKLHRLFRQRMLYYSSGHTPPYESLAQLCDDQLSQVIYKELFSLAYLLPRPALILANLLLREHVQQKDPPERISLVTWKHVVEKWQERSADFLPTGLQAGSRSSERKAIGFTPPHLIAAKPPTVTTSKPTTNALAVNTTLYVNKETNEILLAGENLRRQINPKDLSVLLCLWDHRGEVCSREMIIEEAWKGADPGGVSDYAVNTSISRLRKVFREALKNIRPEWEHIQTYKGEDRTTSGYCLKPEGFKFGEES
jgi:DNA-binding winged helix-turn-helix (wHTH) protein